MRLIIAALALVLTGATANEGMAHDPPAPAATVEARLSGEAVEAAAVVDGFHAALGRGDTAAALQLLAADALIYEEGGAERSRQEYASHHLAADAAFSQAVTSTRSRRIGRAVGDMAWIASEGRTTGRFRDRDVDRLSAETMVLRREGGHWRIVHIHWSSRIPPAAIRQTTTPPAR